MDKIKTCSYVRTSTALEAQEGSYEIQKAYFEELITSDDELEYVGCYGDFGASGRDTEHRPEFMRMIQDCKERKIDAIYTKSVSRFSRSVADFVDTVNMLRSLNIFVYFEKERLNSNDRNMELLLNILAVMAQEESRSLGENVRLGLLLRMSTGHPVGSVPYGFRRIDKDANWAIVEEEAKRIRLMFRMAGKSDCYQDILKALNQLEKEEGTGFEWKKPRLYNMLRSVVYKGDVLTGKTYRKGKTTKRNQGEYDSFNLIGHHDPIVSPKLFDRVQILMDQHLLSTLKLNFKPEQKKFLEDESWMAGQDELEQRRWQG